MIFTYLLSLLLAPVAVKADMMTATYLTSVPWCDEYDATEQPYIHLFEKVRFFADGSLQIEIFQKDKTTGKVSKKPLLNKSENTEIRWRLTGDNLTFSLDNSPNKTQSIKVLASKQNDKKVVLLLDEASVNPVAVKTQCD